MKEDLSVLNKRFESQESGEVLSWFLQNYPGQVVFSTSLGLEDQVLTHMLFLLNIPVRIITLDTGRIFQECYDLLEITTKKYKLAVEVIFPDRVSVEEMVNSRGINLFYESVENRRMCCSVRKTEPLSRALEGVKVWITGLRRDQSVTRNEAKKLEWDEKYNLIKLNPLIDWTEEMVWMYIREHHIPYNTLHDKGFPSIGCAPCTRPVRPGEDVRAGRWWWEHPDNKECGLHK
jgi:phosphoadenosine phosphosulfate reductase